MLPSPTSLLLVAAAASALILPAHPLQLTPTPPTLPPKSWPKSSGAASSATHRASWNRSSRSGGRGGRSGSGQPLRAYTVAENKNSNTWFTFLKFPTSFSDLAVQFGAEDSLFSFEGGGLADIAKRPLMPNLEVEAETMDITTGNDDLLRELDALTSTFEDLQSSMDYKSQLYSETIKSYEIKVETLEGKNELLERTLNALTADFEEQEELLNGLRQGKEDAAMEEVLGLLQAQNNAKVLNEENDALRLRIRALEVELSDVAFESRKFLMPALPTTAAKAATHSIARTDAGESDMEAITSVSTAKFTPKAPTAPPLPLHVHQREHRQFEQQQSSVHKSFGLGLRRGMSKVGNVLNLWNPAYNIALWGQLRG